MLPLEDCLISYPSDDFQKLILQKNLTYAEIRDYTLCICLTKIVKNPKYSETLIHQSLKTVFKTKSDFENFKAKFETLQKEIPFLFENNYNSDSVEVQFSQLSLDPVQTSTSNTWLKNFDFDTVQIQENVCGYSTLKRILFNYNFEELSLDEIYFLVWMPILRLGYFDLSNFPKESQLEDEYQYFSDLIFENFELFEQAEKIICISPCGSGKTYGVTNLVAHYRLNNFLNKTNPEEQFFLYIAPGVQLTSQTFNQLSDIRNAKQQFGFEYPEDSLNPFYYSDEKGTINLEEFSFRTIVITPQSLARIKYKGKSLFRLDPNEENVNIMCFLDETRQLIENFETKTCHNNTLNRFFSDLKTLTWLIKNTKCLIMDATPGLCVKQFLDDVGVLQECTILKNNICLVEKIRFSIMEVNDWDEAVSLLHFELCNDQKIFIGFGSKNLQRIIHSEYFSKLKDRNILILNDNSASEKKIQKGG